MKKKKIIKHQLYVHVNDETHNSDVQDEYAERKREVGVLDPNHHDLHRGGKKRGQTHQDS